MATAPYDTPSHRDERNNPPWLLIAVVVLSIAFVAAVGGGFWQYQRAVQAQTAARIEAERAMQMSEDAMRRAERARQPADQE
jgi:cytochrome oxidase assembly protein ShyY1